MSRDGDSGRTRRSFLRGTGAVATVAAVGTGATGALDDDGPATDRAERGRAAQQGGTYQRSIGSVNSLDPIRTDAASIEVARQLFDGLVAYRNATAQVTTELAASHESNADGTVHTFTLVDAQFHPPGAVGPGIDGAVDREVTASDFVYAFERVAASDHSTWAGLLLETLGVDFERRDASGEYTADNYEPGTLAVEAVDESTLRIELREPFAFPLRVLARTAFAAVPEGIVGDVFGYEGVIPHDQFAQETPIGAGAFVLDERTVNDSVEVRRYDDYHGTTASLDAVFWLTTPGVNAYNYALNRNADSFTVPDSSYDPDKLTVTGTDARGRSVGEYGPMRNGETVAWLRSPANATFYIGFNTNNVPRPVRRAVAYLIDQSGLSREALSGREPPAYHLTPPPVYPGGSGAYDDHVGSEYPYGDDRVLLDEARRVMEGAGYGPDDRFTLSFTYIEGSFWADASSTLASRLDRAHIDLTAEAGSFSDFLGRGQRGELEMYHSGVTPEYPAPEPFLRLLDPGRTRGSSFTNWGVDSQGNRDDTQWSQQARDAWSTIEGNQTQSSTAVEARTAAYVRLEEAMWEDAVLIPVTHGADELFVYDTVQVPKFGLMGHSQQKFNTVVKSPGDGESGFTTPVPSLDGPIINPTPGDLSGLTATPTPSPSPTATPTEEPTPTPTPTTAGDEGEDSDDEDDPQQTTEGGPLPGFTLGTAAVAGAALAAWQRFRSDGED